MTTSSLTRVLCDKCNHPLVGRIVAEREPSLPIYPTEHIPMTSEVSEALSALKNAERVVASYDEEISRLRSRLVEVETAKENLCNRMRSSRWSISAMKRIPAEIWQEIFAFASLPADWTLSIIGHDVLAITLNIAHVCSRWRKIIKAMPELWSSISLNVQNPLPGAVNLIEVYIANSNGHPLKVHIWEQYETSGIINPYDVIAHFGMDGLLAFRKLMEYTAQCRELQLDVAWEMMSVVADQGEVTFPLLRSLDVRRQPDIRDVELVGWFARALVDAPLFTDLRLSFPPSAPEFFPLSQITSLTVEEIYILDSAITILFACTRLETLELSVGDPFSDRISAPDFSTITLPHLRSFTLSSSSPFSGTEHAPSRLLGTLTCPSLSSLTVTSAAVWYQPDQETSRAIVSLIDRSLCSLSTLSILSPLYEASDLPTLLRKCPELNELEIVLAYQEERAISGVFSCLSVFEGNTSDAMVPRLTKLILHAEDSNRVWTPDTVDSLAEMLGSRTKRVKGAGSIEPLTDIRLRLRSKDLADYGVMPSGEVEAGSHVEHVLQVLQDRTCFLRDNGVKCSVEHVNEFYE
ncbi:hypothetical protein V5O48_000148 [Marasmius crinis-equi]|uniref:F-box domain-containing protein n=1 Tax=Marasmius crinis-equi TaxID=585013 RepID=A0ABR3G241_9AGAR